MPRIDIKFFNRRFWIWFVSALLLFSLTPLSASLAAFGDKIEKSKPQFTRMGDKITAKLIPRAKNSSVLINFEVSGGKLLEVQGMNFAEAEHPDVDVKDFKSSLFVAEIGELTPGTEVKVSITSDFFTSETAYWIFNHKLQKPWMNSEAENLSRSGLTRDLVIKVKDGGPFDTDGATNGGITLVGGAKDSFWGYALGTLFIRFFGIFLVLSILMIGMIISGKVFQSIAKRKDKADETSAPQAKEAEDVMSDETRMEISPDGATNNAGTPQTPFDASLSKESVIAVSIALHMHLSALQAPEPLDLSISQITSWTQQGRERIMGDRFLAFNRSNR